MSRSIFTDEQGRNFALPFILISCLFFLSGYTNALLDVLNKYFQEVLGISKAESGLVQFSLYSGYFLMAIPAGLIINRFGFNRGLIFGLLVLIAGTALFVPGAMLKSYYVFLFALFIIACGFTFFETAANPYATLLGRKDASTRRINLAQSFNGIGWIIGPLVGGLIIFSDAAQAGQYNFDYLPIPFVILGVAILVILILLLYRPLPDVLHAEGEDDSRPANAATRKHLSKHPHFILAIVSQFFYVAAQTGINSFFINYVTEADASISNQQASVLLSFGGMSLFVIGRFSGSYFMKWMKPDRLLSLYAIASVLLMVCAVMNMKTYSIIALFMSYFFMSIMYPTIFALGIRGLGEQTKKAASYLVMGIMGGALCPIFMGWIADQYSMAIGFVVPLICFVVVAFYGLIGHRFGDA